MLQVAAQVAELVLGQLLEACVLDLRQRTLRLEDRHVVSADQVERIRDVQ